MRLRNLHVHFLPLFLVHVVCARGQQSVLLRLCLCACVSAQLTAVERGRTAAVHVAAAS